MSFPYPISGDRPRRALLLGDSYSADTLDARLAYAGYETLSANDDEAAQVAFEEEPDVVLVVLGGPDDDEVEESVALARRLRADERTFALPLALVFQRDAAALRLAALGVGADDYFASSTPTAELCARLDSLLWRAEAGRLVPPPADEEAEAAESGAAGQSNEDIETACVEALADAAESVAAPPLQAPTQHVAAEEAAWVYEDGRHTPALASREARMIAALDASIGRLRHAGCRAGASATTSTGALRHGGPKRLLLIVSDASRMAQLNLLIRSAHYEVRTAFDARQALSLLRIERPDLLLVDYELKEMNGVEMLRRLREQQGGRTGPPSILFIPAGREDVPRDPDARAVVTLPYNPGELLDLIHAAGGVD